ncbi:MAG: hypothetical protein WC023_01495 [Rhodocyclaceae bacterium]
MKLDKKKGYGTVSGDPGGACFEQDGRMFDSAGDEIVADAPEAPPAAKKVKADKADKDKAPEAPPAAKTELDEQLAAQG